MKQRHCFSCGAPLDWWEFKKTNFHLSLAYIKRLWKHPSIKFYCCQCYKRIKKNKNEIVINPEMEKI